MGAHHRAEEFEVGKEPVDDELHIHTWMNASLREISDLLKETHPAARERGGRLSFAIVYPDKRGVLVLKEVGSTHALRRGSDDDKTLADLKFQPGDYVDVAVIGGLAA